VICKRGLGSSPWIVLSKRFDFPVGGLSGEGGGKLRNSQISQNPALPLGGGDAVRLLSKTLEGGGRPGRQRPTSRSGVPPGGEGCAKIGIT